MARMVLCMITRESEIANVQVILQLCFSRHKCTNDNLIRIPMFWTVRLANDTGSAGTLGSGMLILFRKQS